MNLDRLLGTSYLPFPKWCHLYCTWKKCRIMPKKVFHRSKLIGYSPYDTHPNHFRLKTNNKIKNYEWSDDGSEYFYVLVYNYFFNKRYDVYRGKDCLWDDYKIISHKQILEELWRCESYDVKRFWGLKDCPFPDYKVFKNTPKLFPYIPPEITEFY